MRVLETTGSWAYNLATWRQANGAAGNQLDFVIGLPEVPVSVQAMAVYGNTSANRTGLIAIGLDSTTAPATGCAYGHAVIQSANVQVPLSATLRTFPGIGRHTVTSLEAGDPSSATGTFYGQNGIALGIQSGIVGEITG